MVMASGLLVVAPHPDDDLLIAAGVIANAKARGEQVKVVFMTNGDFEGQDMGLLREAEAVNAQIQNLGTSEDDIIFLGYPDGGLSPIYHNYPNVSDAYTAPNGRSTTYGSRGRGRADYHTHAFGSAADYNRANVVTDLQSIISTYRPDHIVTTAEHDKHPDHASTFQFVKDALNGAIIANAGYNPSLHKTVVWADYIDRSPVWPALIDPTGYNTESSALASVLAWSERESLDVPYAMQTTSFANNPKYKAIDDHISQGGASTFLGRFVHKDEVFWLESLTGATLPPKASAGLSQTVADGASVQLNGSDSIDPNGGIVSYHWQQIGGPLVILSGANTATPTFQAPAGGLQNSVLSFQLTAQSGALKSLPDLVTVTVLGVGASTQNIAPQATVSASSQASADGQPASSAIDGVADGWPGNAAREWSTVGERAGAWIQLQWSTPATLSRVVLFDRPNGDDFITGGLLTFSDGSSVPVPALLNGGGGLEVSFPPRTASSVRFTATSVSAETQNIGLAEIQVFGTLGGAPVNQPPIAHAGAARTVTSGTQVQLDGSASSDAEGTALSYQWRQIGGNTVALANANSVHPTFTAPGNLAQDATLVFELVVSDGNHESSPTTVTITVTADQPSVNIAGQASATASSQNGADGQFASKVIDGVADGYPGDYSREWATAGEGAGAWIQLNWTTPVSIDRIVLFDRPNGDDQIMAGTLTFSDGSSVPVSALNNDGSASTVTFGARTVTSARLTVTAVASHTQNIGLTEFQVFTAGPGNGGNGGNGNLAPVANAGIAQTVAQGTLVQLNGSASNDPEGAALAYAWRQVGGTQVMLSSANEAQPLFVAPAGLTANTMLSFELVVNDGQVNSAPSIVNVTVAAAPAAINIAPQATVLVSSENSADNQLGAKAVDNVISGYPGDYTREWAAAGQREGAWIELRWATPMVIEKVVLYDRPNSNDQIIGATLTFSDGTTAPVSTLNNDGTATQFNIARTVTSIRLTVTMTGVNSENIGLSEFEVFGNAAQ
jgi:LmbE family N-acetylglucosaminyl deacetylase